MEWLIITLTVLSFIHCEIVKLTCKQIKEFVNGHNDRRLQLAKGTVRGHPPASEMKRMSWDEELAKKAEEWASKQDTKKAFGHNPDSSIPSGRFRTNENLFWYTTTDTKYVMEPKSVLDSWFNEHKNYTFGPLHNGHFKGQGVGHYTQMVWSDSNYVGCAISKNAKKVWIKFLVVCYYGPKGNYLGSKPYVTGPASGKLSCEHDVCTRPYGKRC